MSTEFNRNENLHRECHQGCHQRPHQKHGPDLGGGHGTHTFCFIVNLQDDPTEAKFLISFPSELFDGLLLPTVLARRAAQLHRAEEGRPQRQRENRQGTDFAKSAMLPKSKFQMNQLTTWRIFD